MNYRHGFHAGNFADLAKHAVLLAFLKDLRTAEKPLRVIDTHAGAGLYDLSDPHFARSKEAEAGIKFLLEQDAPDSLKPLADYVRAKNAAAGFRSRIGLYPGSPLMVVDHLGSEGDYIGCELREDDFERLKDTIGRRGDVDQADGYKTALKRSDTPKNLLWLIDPPFERGDDYDRICEVLAEGLKLRPDLMALVWLPLKDLETYDRFLRHLECALFEDISDHGPEVEAAQIRLRPLINPLKMNGCALVTVNAPAAGSIALSAVARDVAALFGDAGSKAVIQSID
ncbi:23S rRNA (adenine(2030)-N(6))-methyltransferase RlmJ [Asticcacaulis tiandongensis]|uniref:23S rRNA (adenine(2030)-N(6))-methyltransferase RlmJ n=1 Tax=Asticcacaulis tiandongensis TaxID=2565365 RepID=UPI001127138D|nr:23S rRNA (adenine(2030)-N(6))-methyltransferase RlmJ [Asticcacaulis tiandongensis]